GEPLPRRSEKEQESRLIIDRIPGLVALLSPIGEVEVVNRPMLEYFGNTVEDVKRWVEGDIIHPADLPRVVEAFAHAIASGTPFEYEARLRRFDGVHCWFQVRGFPDRDSEGSVARWYVLITDIDDLKRAEAFLAGEKRLLEMVASGSLLSRVLDALCRL